MKTDKTTIFDLFQTQRRYVVPLFQRGYVWNEQHQWEPLWADLVSQAAETVRHRDGHSKTLQKHFLGAIVLNLTYTALKRVTVVEIIDGQQRLLTLQVLLAAVRDATQAMGNAWINADLARLTSNQGPFQFDDERFKVWPTSSLQEHVRAVMEAGSAQTLAEKYSQFHKFKYRKWQPPRPGIVEAYVFFSRKLGEYFDDDPEELPFELVDLTREDRAEVLVEALIRNIQLVTIELEQEDDAQVIFETLNARGEPLTPSDLVRNFVFLTATREGENVEDLYDRRWRHFEEDGAPGRPFWKQEERQGRLKRPRLDLFLFHYTTFRTGEEIKATHVYKAFKDWWESGAERSTDQELAELSRYARIYKSLLEPDVQTRFGRFANRLRVLDTAVVYPVVLWAAGELALDSKEMHGIITDLESYFIRRAVCGYGAKSYSRLFLEWYSKLREAGVHPSREALHGMLASSQSESAIWPSDAEFQKHLVEDPLYQLLQSRRALMLLEALNEASASPWAEGVVITAPLTVEHVLPQYPSPSDWPLPVGVDEWDATVRRDRLTHALGNLTLLTQPLNSSISNGSYAAKRPEIAKQSLLPLNAYFQDQLTWDEDEIVRRGRVLADLALKIWPGP